jgi:prevent-host-death family protein
MSPNVLPVMFTCIHFSQNEYNKYYHEGECVVKTLTATELQDKFSEVVEGIRSGPVLVEKSGRPVAVILSYQDFERFRDLEDAWWGEQAHNAATKGILSVQETASWIADRLNETPPE